MLLRVTLPANDPTFRSGIVAKWHVAEGAPVGFGDPLCDISIDQFAAMRRTEAAALLGTRSRLRLRRVRGGVSIREDRGVAHVTLKCSEPGAVLGKVVAAEGDRVVIGGLVAVLTDGDGTGPISDADLASAVEARVVADFPDSDLSEMD